ncbi:MAG: CaiB/BaiF CoA transferase family protein [Sphingomonadales bacterium]
MGPLQGVKVIEMAGLGPAPFCAMMLADMGADVVRIERPGGASLFPGDPTRDLLNRGKRVLTLDLKAPEAVATILSMCGKADILIEGFRPGVMERLGLGPEECMARNPRLVYGRMTGWGQDGPLAQSAGHDINYIALAGALHGIGEKGRKPVPPLNLIGDFGGGGMMLAFGVVCAMWEAGRSGRGQVVDAAMVDGAAALMTSFYGLREMGLWGGERGSNLLDGGAPFYDTYETADGKHIALGSLEPQFYALLVELAGLDREIFANQYDAARWPEMKEELSAVIKRKTRDEWCRMLEGSDACFAPVLSMTEAADHPHNEARGTFVEVDGITQPAPTPRFSRTKPEIQGPPQLPAKSPDDLLAEWGLDDKAIAALRNAGAVGE